MNNNTNTTTAPEMPEATSVKVFAPAEPMACAMVAMSISDYLDSDITAPVYQRPYVWQPKQADALIDSITSGYPLPPVIVADITDNGKQLSLLIDGVQRTTTIRQYIDAVNADDEYQSAQLDYVLGASINVMRVTCNSAQQAAELFIRYNSGSSLNGIQRTKANLPQAVLTALTPYITWAQAFGVAKMGKVTPDTAAMMIAASLVDGSKSTSAGASAGKVLAAAQALPAMPAAMAIVQDAIMSADEDALDYWTSPARLVPLVMAVNDTTAELTADGLSKWLMAYNPADRKTYKVTTVGKGKQPVTSRKPMSVASAMSDTGNGHGATNARYWILRGALEDTANDATANVASAIAEAMV